LPSVFVGREEKAGGKEGDSQVQENPGYGDFIGMMSTLIPASAIYSWLINIFFEHHKATGG